VASSQSTVQATPSDGQGTAPATQPVAGLQASAPLQKRPSSHVTAAPPRQVPPVHTSPVVQAFASVHAVPSATGAATQPCCASQVSLVQLLPSLQSPAFGVCVQASVFSSQASVVQAMPSSQFGAAPGVHTPATHVSKPLHAAPS
jgi:hypothetical protein